MFTNANPIRGVVGKAAATHASYEKMEKQPQNELEKDSRMETRVRGRVKKVGGNGLVC